MIGRPLKLIVDDLERLNDECNQWYLDNVQKKLMDCKTQKEVNTLLGDISLQCCSDDGTMRDIPPNIHIPIIWQTSAFVYKDGWLIEKEKQNDKR